jgi:hypothetical protein
MAPHEIVTRSVLYEIPGMLSIAGRPGEFTGADGRPLPLAVYLPPTPSASPPPVVILVEGYPDPGFAAFLGCRFMDMAWSISTARLIAASGLAAITYANREPVADALAVVEHVRARATSLGIDATRLGLWAASGHGPVALSLVSHATCAVLLNPMTFDQGGATHIADAARTFTFAAPAMDAMPAGKPLFVVRSGTDEMPGLNTALDRFVAYALAANHPLTVVNHPDAPHAFDLFHDSTTTRDILRQALSFLAVTLGVRSLTTHEP